MNTKDPLRLINSNTGMIKQNFKIVMKLSEAVTLLHQDNTQMRLEILELRNSIRFLQDERL